MEGLLNKYSRRCQEAHETRTNRDLLQMLPPDLAADVVALHPSRHTHRGKPLVIEEGEGDVSSMSDDSALQHRQMDVLKPLGLAPEDVKLPLSPRSNDAYARINEEFDLLYSQLQEVNEQAGQNHAERSPTSNDSMAGGAAGKGKRGGKQGVAKKKGNTKTRKREAPAAAVKKAAIKAATKAAASTAQPQEEIGEGGLPGVEGTQTMGQGGSSRRDRALERDVPAGSTAGRAAAPADAPTSSAVAAPQRGGDDKNGATSAPCQQPGAAQADATSPAASVAPYSARQQAAGQEAQQQFRSSAMPLGAVDISRAGASAPALPDDNTDAAAPNVDRADVTFAPHQLATYTTPNFYMGDAAALLRDASSSRPSQPHAATLSLRSGQASRSANPQNSTSAAPKSSTSHAPLHAEPSFSHGGAFPGKRKRSQDNIVEGAAADTATLHAIAPSASPVQNPQHAQQPFVISLPRSQLGAAGSAPATAQVLTAGMPVQ